MVVLLIPSGLGAIRAQVVVVLLQNILPCMTVFLIPSGLDIWSIQREGECKCDGPVLMRHYIALVTRFISLQTTLLGEELIIKLYIKLQRFNHVLNKH
jgi:hypothetical protein